MEFLHQLWLLIRHLDPDHMRAFVDYCGLWVYVALFAIIFCETGLVVTPFLPGDSLLFVTGTVAALGVLHLPGTICVALAAAVLGDAVNYHIGDFIGPRAFATDRWFFRRKHLDRTHKFFEKYGGKTIVIARFIPIVRTFAPFVAGVGTMPYRYFLLFNFIGALLWVFLLLFAGFWFGNTPLVQRHYELVIVAIVVLSVLPGVVELVRAGRHGKRKEN